MLRHNAELSELGNAINGRSIETTDGRLHSSWTIANPEPITQVKDDLFGFDVLAQVVAHVIGRLKLNRSAWVVGVIGDWGSGKTSLINLIEAHLKSDKDSKFKVMSFNPWQFSGHTELVSQFMKEMLVKLTQYNDSALFEVAKSFFSKIVPDQVGLSVDLGCISFEAAKELNKNENKSAEQLKAELSELLKNQEKRLVIIIDDLDRCHQSEIRDVFRLVKAVCDLPNIIFILGFDKQIIANALEAEGFFEGNKYLEKIIQQEIEVPRITAYELQHQLEKYLSEFECEEIKKICEEKEQFGRFEKIWRYGLCQLIRTQRNIYTLINNFVVTQTRLDGEVNKLDVLGSVDI